MGDTKIIQDVDYRWFEFNINTDVQGSFETLIPFALYPTCPSFYSSNDFTTPKGTLQIEDKDHDGRFDAGELQVSFQDGTSISTDGATIQSVLNEICITNIQLGTPYDSLRKFASLYELANSNVIAEQITPYSIDHWTILSESPTPSIQSVAQLEKIAENFESAKTTPGITVDEEKMTKEGIKLYAKLRDQAFDLHHDAINWNPESPQELRELASLNQRICDDVDNFSWLSGGTRSYSAVIREDAFDFFATIAWGGFEYNAAKDSKGALEYLELYREYAAQVPQYHHISEPEIKRIWRDAAKENVKKGEK